MTTNLNNIPTNFILSSPESIRKKVLDRLIEYEELHGVDLSKTNFFSYMVDVISMLSADNSNAISLSKRETYLITANLPSSVYNWASYLSYSKDFAKPAAVDVVLTIPLEFKENTTFKIDYFTKFYAGDIVYTNPNEYYIFDYDYSTNMLTGKAISTNSVRSLRVIPENNIAYTSIRLEQVEKLEEERYIPHELQAYQPYSFTLVHSYKLSDIKLFMKEDPEAEEEEWPLSPNYFQMGLGEKTFAFSYESLNKIRIMFGNGIFGRQPKPGSIARLEIYTTKADAGAIISSAINKMDKIIYLDSQGIAKYVSITPTNIVASTLGAADESLADTKRKAIARFSARRRTVSEGDMNSIIDVVENELPFTYVRAILKRSDLKINEIVLYVVLPQSFKTYEPQVISEVATENNNMVQTIPIPTNSLTKTIDATITNIAPYATYIDDSDGLEYICPFGLMKETDTFYYYYYILKSVQLTPDAIVYDQITYPLSFLQLNINSNTTYDTMSFSLSYFNLDNAVNMSNIEAKLYLRFRSTIKGPFNCTIDNIESKINVDLDMNEILSEPCGIEFHLLDITTNQIIAITKSDYYMRRKLRTTVYSDAVTVSGNATIYDIPCILKEYYDELTEDERIHFESTIIQQTISTSNMSDYRMMNVSLNIKFAKTFGKIVNYDLNEETMPDVLSIQNDPPVSPTSGDRYIVGPEPTGIWSDYRSKVALYGADTWVFLDADPGTIIKVLDEDKRYTFSGNANRWMLPSYNIPYDINVFVHVNEMAESDAVVIEKVKQQLMYSLVPYFGVDKEQFRSVMYKSIQELGTYINYCEIKIPEVNIKFDYNIRDFTSEQLRRYVPEFIYTDIDHIRVIVVRS
jgi:hypothetical protein